MPAHRAFRSAAVAAAAAAALLAAPALGGGKGSDIGGPPEDEQVHRPQQAVDPSALSDAEKEARFKVIQKRYEELKRNQDVLQTRQRRADVRFVGQMRYTPAAKWLETVFDTDRDTQAQVAAMLAVGQTGELAQIQAIVKKALLNVKKDPVFASSLPRVFRDVRNPEVGRWLAERLDAKEPDVLASLVESAGLTRAPEAVPRLEELIEKSKDPAVRFEAIRAYGRCGRERAVSRLFNLLSDPDWRIRMATAEGLRFAGDPRAISELKRLVIDGEEPIVVETAVEAVGELGLAGDGTKESIQPLIDALHAGRARCREKARQYLVQYARKFYRQSRDYATDHEAWARWYEKVKHGWDPDDPAEKRRETSAFFRFRIASDQILFVLDVSGSMDWPGNPQGVREGEWRGRRIDLARTELYKTLRSLDKDTVFNVAVFSGAVASWQKQEVPAAKENVEAAIEWVSRQLPRGGTATYDALEYGIAKTRCDTIYFLSDGVPSAGRYDQPETILSEIRKANRFRRVSINTIAFIVGKADYESVLKYEDPEEMADFMSRVAEENFGGFEDQSRP